MFIFIGLWMIVPMASGLWKFVGKRVNVILEIVWVELVLVLKWIIGAVMIFVVILLFFATYYFPGRNILKGRVHVLHFVIVFGSALVVVFWVVHMFVMFVCVFVF